MIARLRFKAGANLAERIDASTALIHEHHGETRPPVHVQGRAYMFARFTTGTDAILAKLADDWACSFDFI